MKKKNHHIKLNYVNNFFVKDIAHMVKDVNLVIKRKIYLILVFWAKLKNIKNSQKIYQKRQD